MQSCLLVDGGVVATNNFKRFAVDVARSGRVLCQEIPRQFRSSICRLNDTIEYTFRVESACVTFTAQLVDLFSSLFFI